MTQAELASLSFAELRDRLKARAFSEGDTEEDVDISEALRYLGALPVDEHTADSVDALVQLARNFHYAARSAEFLQAASLAARFATALGDKLQLCVARLMQGGALSDLGRFAEATVAQAEAWSLARDLGDKQRETHAILNFGTLCGSMGQSNVAVRYAERALELAETYGLAFEELVARNSLAFCAVELGEPAVGLNALSQFSSNLPQTREATDTLAYAQNTLARLHLLCGDLSAARAHAEESARLATIARSEKSIRNTEAVLGLIDVLSGAVAHGLATLNRTLAFARHADHTALTEYLSLCVDAYEAIGDSEKALEYLHELAALKKESIEAEVTPLQYEGLTEPIQFQVDTSLFGDLLARTRLLQTDVQIRIERLVETAINAEIAGGHDLYRTFRVAKLTRCLAAALGWDEDRIGPLALGAQLCNIGMIVVPVRILQKHSGLSDGERQVLSEHTWYGAELLRKSRLRVLDIASVIAEQHHERSDGSGYPHGLRGAGIAEEARIVSICDAFDAMTHRRPWRPKPLSVQAALYELKRCGGAQFEHQLVNAFIDFVRREFWEHDDFDAFLAEGANELEYVRARARMEGFIADRSLTPHP